jgi:DNA (cytosine-5)-methyltransferase 1
MKILNLYAGIGGNRMEWGNEHQIDAVEWDKEIAGVYHDFYPDDRVLVEDAHKFLEKNYQDYDFIWSSPPCPTYSRMRKQVGVASGLTKAAFPNMMLYEEILFLDGYFKGKWCIENVISWYDPLVKPQQLGRHYFWANFKIFRLDNLPDNCHIADGTVRDLERAKGISLAKFPMSEDRKGLLLRNTVEPVLGKHIFDCAFTAQKKLEF